MKKAWLKGKEWWSQLAPREKQGALIGGSLLALFISYQWIWTPYLDHINAMRARIKSNQKMLVWMQEKDQAIRKIEKKWQPSADMSSPMLLLSVMKKQVNQAELEQYLTQLKQGANGSLELHFQKVAFDKFVPFLIAIIKKERVTIERMSVLADNTPGVVNADLIVKV